MATSTMLRTETSGPTTPSAHGSGVSDLEAFRSGRPAEDRLVDLLAFALAAEKRQSPGPETIEVLRAEASKVLSEHAFRYLHNSVEQIRQDAVTEQLGALRRPPGFFRLVLANLVAIFLAALAAFGLAQAPATLFGLMGLMAG